MSKTYSVQSSNRTTESIKRRSLPWNHSNRWKESRSHYKNYQLQLEIQRILIFQKNLKDVQLSFDEADKIFDALVVLVNVVAQFYDVGTIKLVSNKETRDKFNKFLSNFVRHNIDILNGATIKVSETTKEFLIKKILVSSRRQLVSFCDNLLE